MWLESKFSYTASLFSELLTAAMAVDPCTSATLGKLDDITQLSTVRCRQAAKDL